MSERDGFQAGVPCWVAAVLPDPEAGVAFYTELFGWEAADIMPPDGPGRYYVCTLGGRAVAAVGSGRGGQAPDVPAWGTYIWVDSADATATQAAEAGGSVLAAPFDLLDAGRLAVLADPAGAVFCAFEPGRLRGAQVVNQPGAWAMSTLATPDPDSATAFYGSLFGADVVGVMLPQDPGDPPPHWSIDFWVADTTTKATNLGAKLLVPPFDSPTGRTGILADPQGATFSLSTAPTGP